MARTLTPATGLLLMVGLGACAGIDAGRLDIDMRDNAVDAFDTSEAVSLAAADRPSPDANGLITYPNYQVAVARRGDTVGDVAARIGLSGEELARFNGLDPEARLNAGAILALPRRVTATGSSGRPDIGTIAGNAIARATGGTPSPSVTPVAVQTGQEPVRHRVARGETAFSIARLYGVTPAALADWNGLGSDFSVREGQYLMIPLVIGENGAEVVAEPGGQADVPPPPSAASALPEAVEAVTLPSSPNLNDSRTDASAGVATVAPAAASTTPEPSGGGLALRPPVDGSIREPFSSRSEGLAFDARAGSPVRAVAEGTVAAITRDTDQVPILIVRHADGYLSVYANIDDIRVAKGDSVRQGQRLASVGAAEPSFLHFELRRGLEAIDPTPFLR